MELAAVLVRIDRADEFHWYRQDRQGRHFQVTEPDGLAERGQVLRRQRRRRRTRRRIGGSQAIRLRASPQPPAPGSAPRPSGCGPSRTARSWPGSRHSSSSTARSGPRETGRRPTAPLGARRSRPRARRSTLGGIASSPLGPSSSPVGKAVSDAGGDSPPAATTDRNISTSGEPCPGDGGRTPGRSRPARALLLPRGFQVRVGIGLLHRLREHHVEVVEA